MKNKAVFLDRDGTINVDYGYIHTIDKFEFIEGVPEALHRLQQAGYLLIVITNQSGIARGYYTEDDFRLLCSAIDAKLAVYHVKIDKTYYCPHLNGCQCRKPKLELFYKAAKEFDIDFSKSFAVGDKERDLSICGKEPVQGFLIGSFPEKSHSFLCVSSLQEAVDQYILKSYFS
jgi:D-glycero-D-manno-heptose 1,7-bisphosphate phosphatase